MPTEKSIATARVDRPVLDVVEITEGVLDVVIYTDKQPDADSVDGLADTPRRAPLRVH